MDAYFINLDSAIERRNLIEKQIASSNLLFKIDRFTAVLGKEYPEKPATLSNGQWGCWQSHIQVIKKSLTNNEHLLIIEDDEMFTSMLNHAYFIVDRFPNIDWDIIYLDLTIVEIEDYLFISRKLEEILKQEKPPELVHLPRDFTAYGTHAYIINKTKKNKIFNFLDRNCQIGLPIDNVYCAGLNSGHINSYALLPLVMSPGIESTNSQINHGAHPLENCWFRYRNLLSIDQITEKSSQYLEGNLIEEVTKNSIQERINFSPLRKFSPLKNSNQKLKE